MGAEILSIVLSSATAAWLLAFVLQLVDVVTGHQVRRAARAAGTHDRDRVLVWTVTVCALVLVLLVLGVDLAARLILDHGQLLAGAVILILLAVAGAFTTLLAALAIRRPQTGYRVLREELRSLKGTRLTKGRIADYRSWLQAIDARSRDLRRRVLSGRVLRAVPPVVALVSLGAAVWLAAAGGLTWWGAAGFAVPFGASVWLAVAGARSSLARNLAVHAVRQKQRAELVAELEELERRAPRKVTGLSDRVSRALAILREQQGQEPKH